MLLSLSVLAVLVVSINADCYMHNPRGSNNRFDTEDDDADVENNDRLFDSQNNDDGGYDCARGSTYPKSQTPMQYYVGSELVVQWSSQHACGKDSPVNCEMVLQYTCGNEENGGVRDGSTNDRILQGTGNAIDVNNRENYLEEGKEVGYGMHEDFRFYYACSVRERNRGLFIADRTLNGNTARFTRQNNNGNRDGLECAEERDYYPYWTPTPWKDIAVLTGNTERCEYYWDNTQNTNSKHECIDAATALKWPAMPNNKAACTSQQNENGITYTWQETAPFFHDRVAVENGASPPNVDVPFTGAGDPEQRVECREARAAAQALGTPQAADNAEKLCRKMLGGPHCLAAPHQRMNHLGFVYGGYMANYTWLLPNDPSPNCVLRLRYNMTSDDYDGWNTYSDRNGKERPTTPLEQDMWVTWSWSMPIELALNTNQYARTFQDRSHVFAIAPRPASIPASAKIHNVNVRGKRGTVSQVYPSPTFEFTPKDLHVQSGDFVHWQWEGGSSLPERYWGGGQQRTERHNLVQIANAKSNWPLQAESSEVQAATPLLPFTAEQKLHFAMAGQEDHVDRCLPFDLPGCVADPVNEVFCNSLAQEAGYNPLEENDNTRYEQIADMRMNSKNCMWLNRAPATFASEPVQINAASGTKYYYMSTRDNAPGFQSMKGIIYVD